MKLSSRDASAISLGLEFVTAVVVGAGGGYVLDRHFHTSPWFLLVGLALGAVAAFRALLAMARPSKSDDDDPTSTDAKP